jgi:hypothetical protein
VASADRSSVVPTDAAPISIAPAGVTPVSAVPVSAAPASAAPPASVALASADPANANPANASPANADPGNADAAVTVPITAHPSSGTTMVQLSTTATRDSAQADWRRIQHHLPDLLALHQPFFVQTGNEGNVRWGVRTDGFAGPEDAKAFCGTIKARGFGCFVTLAQNLPVEPVTQASAISSAASPTPDVASPTDAGPGASATQAGGQSGGSVASAASAAAAPTNVAAVSATPANAAPANAASPASAALASAAPPASAVLASADQTAVPPAGDAPASADPANADPGTARPASGATMVQLSTTATRDAAKADWRRIQHHLSDLLSDRQPAFVQTDSAGSERWGVRTGGFGGYAAAKDFCDTIKARGFGCFVTGS